MSSHNPLQTKVQNLTEKLNRSRLSASETSETLIRERNAFFDRLALLNAGALTFSVTLFASLSLKNPRSLIFVHTAWISLLIAVAACLIRNLVHQHYRSSFASASLASAEVAYLDAYFEVISTQVVAYSDSSERFDKDREIKLNRESREKWKKKLAEWETLRDRHWGLVRVTEWVAAVSMLAGFLLLIIFAIVNTHSTARNSAPSAMRCASRWSAIAAGAVHRRRPVAPLRAPHAMLARRPETR